MSRRNNDGVTVASFGIAAIIGYCLKVAVTAAICIGVYKLMMGG